ncbi:MAG: hypothetical protein AAF667_19775 [Pseudomonadota bacterium]
MSVPVERGTVSAYIPSSLMAMAGGLLLTEGELCDALGVGRSSVREAGQAMSGLVECAPDDLGLGGGQDR